MKNKLKFIFLGLTVVSLVGAIVATVMDFIQEDVNNSIEFIEVANQSIMQAKAMLDAGLIPQEVYNSKMNEILSRM